MFRNLVHCGGKGLLLPTAETYEQLMYFRKKPIFYVCERNWRCPLRRSSKWTFYWNMFRHIGGLFWNWSCHAKRLNRCCKGTEWEEPEHADERAKDCHACTTVVRHVPSRIFDCQSACTHDRTNARKFQEKLATGLEPLRTNTPTYGEMEPRLKQNKIHQLLLSWYSVFSVVVLLNFFTNLSRGFWKGPI